MSSLDPSLCTRGQSSSMPCWEMRGRCFTPSSPASLGLLGTGTAWLAVPVSFNKLFDEREMRTGNVLT